MAEARTEQASPDRLARARARGDAPVSRVLTTAAALCAFLAVAAAQRHGLLVAWQDALRTALATAPNSQFEPARALAAAVQLASSAVAAPLFAAAVAALLVGLVQSGGMFAPGALRGELEPMARLRALFAPERALDALSATIAVLVLTAVAAYTLGPSLPGVLALAGSELSRAIDRVSALAWTLALRLALTALVLGLIDAVVRRVRRSMRLRMSWRELREEQREQYGDPQLRAERMRRARRGGS